MKKLVALMMALVMALSCAMAATAEEAKTSIAVCLASEPDTLDPALNSAVDGATLTSHLFSGLATLGAERGRQAGDRCRVRDRVA